MINIIKKKSTWLGIVSSIVISVAGKCILSKYFAIDIVNEIYNLSITGLCFTCFSVGSARLIKYTFIDYFDEDCIPMTMGGASDIKSNIKVFKPNVMKMEGNPDDNDNGKNMPRDKGKGKAVDTVHPIGGERVETGVETQPGTGNTTSSTQNPNKFSLSYILESNNPESNIIRPKSPRPKSVFGLHSSVSRPDSSSDLYKPEIESNQSNIITRPDEKNNINNTNKRNFS